MIKKMIKITAGFLFAAALFTFALPMPGARAADATSMAGIVATSGDALQVRSGPGAGSAAVTKLSSGAYVTLVGKSGGWWQVEYAQSRYGYVSDTYIRQVWDAYPLKAATASGSLNVRSAAGANYARVGAVANGQTVLVLSVSNGWARILYNGTRTGYVSARYLGSVMTWPVPVSHKINQYFGEHKGLDIGPAARGVAGDRVVAAQAGKIVYSGWLNGYGYVVYVNSVYNGQPIQTRYGHLASAPSMKAGDAVGIGQTLGYMGNTGTSTGVHLHFEIRIRKSAADCIANADSTAVNPLNYVQ